MGHVPLLLVKKRAACQRFPREQEFFGSASESCFIRVSGRTLNDPAAAHYHIAVVEYGGLAGRDGTLRLVEGH
jgi:hypothetical protein